MAFHVLSYKWEGVGSRGDDVPHGTQGIGLKGIEGCGDFDVAFGRPRTHERVRGEEARNGKIFAKGKTGREAPQTVQSQGTDRHVDGLGTGGGRAGAALSHPQRREPAAPAHQSLRRFLHEERIAVLPRVRSKQGHAGRVPAWPCDESGKHSVHSDHILARLPCSRDFAGWRSVLLSPCTSACFFACDHFLTCASRRRA